MAMSSLATSLNEAYDIPYPHTCNSVSCNVSWIKGKNAISGYSNMGQIHANPAFRMIFPFKSIKSHLIFPSDFPIPKKTGAKIPNCAVFARPHPEDCDPRRPGPPKFSQTFSQDSDSEGHESGLNSSWPMNPINWTMNPMNLATQWPVKFMVKFI